MNPKKLLRLSAIVLALALLFPGCSRTLQSLSPEGTPTPSATQDVAQVSATPSATPAKLPAITPTINPTIKPTAVPTPEETEKPEEPEIIYDTNPKIIVKSNGEQVLKCKYFNFTITFPKSWKGKYLVAEFKRGLLVYFKPADLTPITHDGRIDYPKFFSIYKVTPDTETDPDEMIADNLDFFTIKGVKYMMYGPTDFLYPSKGPEVDTFVRMNNEAFGISDKDNIGIESK